MSHEILDGEQYANLRTVYSELCSSYRAIDEFRTKLLGFLPLATGAGIFFLVTDDAKIRAVTPYLGPLGGFGAAITLGLFFYELYGIKKCAAIIDAGTELEGKLDIKSGQFAKRPNGVLCFINEPMAAGVIYPAVLAAWIFIALAFSRSTERFAWLALLVFAAGLVASTIQNLKLIGSGCKQEREKRRRKQPVPPAGTGKNT